MNFSIYAVRDKVSGTIGSQVWMFRAVAAAVRFFHDVMSDPESYPSKHCDDFDLVCLGQVSDEGVIEPSFRVVVEGSAWRDMMAAKAASLSEVK